VGRSWRIQNRKKFEKKCAGKFSRYNFTRHFQLVIQAKAVLRNRMESVSKEGKLVRRELF
jgi:hypothetical protein